MNEENGFIHLNCPNFLREILIHFTIGIIENRVIKQNPRSSRGGHMVLNVPILVEHSSVYLSHLYTNLTGSCHLADSSKHIILSVRKGFVGLWCQYLDQSKRHMLHHLFAHISQVIVISYLNLICFELQILAHVWKIGRNINNAIIFNSEMSDQF